LEGKLKTYPKNDPIGVLTAETMYTGGKVAIFANEKLKLLFWVFLNI
jgi:hypothetical protein